MSIRDTRYQGRHWSRIQPFASAILHHWFCEFGLPQIESLAEQEVAIPKEDKSARKRRTEAPLPIEVLSIKECVDIEYARLARRMENRSGVIGRNTPGGFAAAQDYLQDAVQLVLSAVDYPQLLATNIVWKTVDTLQKTGKLTPAQGRSICKRHLSELRHKVDTAAFEAANGDGSQAMVNPSQLGLFEKLEKMARQILSLISSPKSKTDEAWVSAIVEHQGFARSHVIALIARNTCDCPSEVLNAWIDTHEAFAGEVHEFRRVKTSNGRSKGVRWSANAIDAAMNTMRELQQLDFQRVSVLHSGDEDTTFKAIFEQSEAAHPDDGPESHHPGGGGEPTDTVLYRERRPYGAQPDEDEVSDDDFADVEWSDNGENLTQILTDLTSDNDEMGHHSPASTKPDTRPLHQPTQQASTEKRSPPSYLREIEANAEDFTEFAMLLPEFCWPVRIGAVVSMERVKSSELPACWLIPNAKGKNVMPSLKFLAALIPMKLPEFRAQCLTAMQKLEAGSRPVTERNPPPTLEVVKGS